MLKILGLIPNKIINTNKLNKQKNSLRVKSANPLIILIFKVEKKTLLYNIKEYPQQKSCLKKLKHQ
jgi:hypothetical protein